MVLEKLIVETDLDQSKEILLDNNLRGLSSMDSNFNQILRPYALKDGTKILGTKAVLINSVGFLEEFSKNYNLSPDIVKELSEKINENPLHKPDTETSFTSYFWDNTSEVHHRDIMRCHFKSFEQQLEQMYIQKSQQKDIAEKEFEQALNIEKALNDLNLGLEQLYETKKGGRHNNLTDAGKIMLKYSQGYQLSSSKVKEENNLWKSQIRKVEMSSGITKDQETYNIAIPLDETTKSVQYFLKCLENVEYKTNTFEMPSIIGNIGTTIDVINTPTHKKSNGEYIAKASNIKSLKINYN